MWCEALWNEQVTGPCLDLYLNSQDAGRPSGELLALRCPRGAWYVSPLVCQSGGPACCPASPARRGLGQCSPTATYSGRQDLLTASVSVV